MSQWKDICKIDDILPETGVCALLGKTTISIYYTFCFFRLIKHILHS